MSVLVKIMSETSLSLFTLTFFIFFLCFSCSRIPLSSLPPDQTLSCVSDTCREVTGSTLQAQIRTDVLHKRTNNNNKKYLFMWLALLHHWWNVNFLATRRNVTSRLVAVVLTLADLIIGCLLCCHYSSQLILLFCNLDKERMPLVDWIRPNEVHCLRDRFKGWMDGCI